MRNPPKTGNRKPGPAMNSRQALDHIENHLKRSMPELKYYQKTNEKGRYLVVEQSGMIGMAIGYNGGRLSIESIIPSERINKRFGRAAKFLQLFRRKKRHELIDNVLVEIKKLTR